MLANDTLAIALNNAKASGANAKSMHLVDARFCSMVERALRGREGTEFVYTRSRQCFRDDFQSLTNILMLTHGLFSIQLEKRRCHLFFRSV